LHIYNPAKTVAAILFFILFSIVPLSFAQQLSGEELDSLYNRYIQVRAPHLLELPEELTPEERKCGFEIVNRVKINFESFSAEQQAVLKPLLQRPVMHTSIVSPSGFFRIHYDTTGFSVPSYLSGSSIETNVQEVVKAMDSTYSFEVDYLGYPAPPPDGNEGGDNLFDVYITNLGNLYGYTDPESKIGVASWSSFIVIDDDYQGFFSPGISGLQVTAAHEFHHAIQVGNYAIDESNTPFRDSDKFFFELTSTSMEEFVFDEVNDYYAYIKNYTNNPSRSFTRFQLSLDGYDLAIWNIFVVENFDFDILKQQWKMIPTQNAINAIHFSLINAGSSFPSEYNKFGIWTYFTDFRAVPGLYFAEAANYPLINPISTIVFPQYTYSQVDAQATSNNFIKFNNITNGDTLYAIITNGDINSAGGSQFPLFSFKYTLFADSISGDRKLTDNYSAKFEVGNSNWWSVSEILNDVVIRADSNQIIPSATDESFVFPNPFTYADLFTGFQPFINISFEASSGTNVDFHVYSSGMMQVFSSEEIIGPLRNNSVGITWDGLDNDENKLASGVYIYVIKNGDDIVKGKVVIFNE